MAGFPVLSLRTIIQCYSQLVTIFHFINFTDTFMNIQTHNDTLYKCCTDTRKIMGSSGI